jgi:hypothetical protein
VDPSGRGRHGGRHGRALALALVVATPGTVRVRFPPIHASRRFPHSLFFTLPRLSHRHGHGLPFCLPHLSYTSHSLGGRDRSPIKNEARPTNAWPRTVTARRPTTRARARAGSGSGTIARAPRLCELTAQPTPPAWRYPRVFLPDGVVVSKRSLCEGPRARLFLRVSQSVDSAICFVFFRP